MQKTRYRNFHFIYTFNLTGPDNVPSRILNSFAHVLAEPITIIFNASLSSSVVPKIWKESNIIRCLKGTSTTYCLLDMIHSWLSHLDSSSNGKHIRVIFLDFSKAFDRIGHTFLIEKLLDLALNTFFVSENNELRSEKLFLIGYPLPLEFPKGLSLARYFSLSW